MKRLFTTLCYCFELTDDEYIRATFGPWPFRFFVTVFEPNRRWNWRRRLFPWRIRCSVATLMLKWMWSTCTKCGRSFSLGELWVGWRQVNLIHFQSGSVCHRNCPPA